MKSLDRSCIPWVLKAWWSKRGLRLLVALLVVAGAVDIAYTSTFIENFGATGELNPAVRHFYQERLIIVWLTINILASLFGGMILGSLATLSKFQVRKAAATGFGLLLGLRFATTSIALTNYYLLSWLGWSVVFTGFVIFLIVRRYLTEGYLVRGEVLRLALGDWYSAMQDFLDSVLLCIRKGLVEHKLQVSETGLRKMERTTFTRRFSPQEKRRLFIVGLTVIVVLILLLGLLTILQNIVFSATPWWLRELGLVTEIQAQAFLVGFVAILVSMAVLFYTLSSLVEIISRSRGD